MCSRYELNATAREVAGRFALTVPPPLPNRAEVRPTDPALVVLPGHDGRLLRWGLAVDWDKRPLINARAETLATRPVFRRLLSSRVAIPATLWFEWRKQPDGRKAKVAIHRPDNGLLAFAGLMEGDRFILVTCEPCPALAAIHDRMPAVLAPEVEAAWLDPALPFARVAEVLRPYAGDLATEEGEPPRQPTLFA